MKKIEYFVLILDNSILRFYNILSLNKILQEDSDE